MDQGGEFRLLEMEEKLASDVNGAFRKQVLDELEQLSAQVRRHIDAGLPPDEYKQYEMFRQSIEASMEVINKVWEGMH